MFNGTVLQNTFSLKSTHIGCIDLWNQTWSSKLRKTKVALFHPKYCGQKFRGPKLRENILKANMPRAVLYQSTLAPRSFGWSNATIAPQSFGDIASAEKITTMHIWKYNFLSYFKVIFVNLWHFRDLDKQYDHFLRKKVFSGHYL